MARAKRHHIPGQIWHITHRCHKREFLLAHGKLTIKDFEELCPGVNRRSLQRDLKAFLEKGLIKETGTGPTDPTRHYVLS